MVDKPGKINLHFALNFSCMTYILDYSQIRITDTSIVGGKNASLGELYNVLRPNGINVPGGFVVTADAFRYFTNFNNIKKKLNEILSAVSLDNESSLTKSGEACRNLVLKSQIPPDLQEEILKAYKSMHDLQGKFRDVAVRSSATAEDLPGASFAGRMDSFLNIRGGKQVLKAVLRCYASLFTDRAIKYRIDLGFGNMDIAISVGVQQMIRSDLASSGVAFTIDPDSGHRDFIVINGTWGLGENIVQGKVTPDEWMVFKRNLAQKRFHPLLHRLLGKKEYTLKYSAKSGNDSLDSTTNNETTPDELKSIFCLADDEVLKLADWCHAIEKHYNMPMDIEWAKDGVDGQLYIVQARPETVHFKTKIDKRKVYKLSGSGKVLAQGIALGNKISVGQAIVLTSPSESYKVKQGDIVVTDITNPDWDPILKKASAIITNKGGRTSHAAIVARELGTTAIVGCGDATQSIKSGQSITASCSEGKTGYVYEDRLEFNVNEEEIGDIKMPSTKAMLIVSDPDRALEYSLYPNEGVGLLRLEFTITNSIKVHPLALLMPDRVKNETQRKLIDELTEGYQSGKDYFVQKLSESVALVAAAFHPRDVVVRMSDFKSNEYANLAGGSFFEPEEENPMIGLRGASRYYSDFYRPAFELECAAMMSVRNDYGMKNVKLMIPFCRTTEEGEQVLAEMHKNGLEKGKDGLEIYVMIEIPSNAINADRYAELFDGFSIGSNDLTQLTLGLDRDSEHVNYLFNEMNPAVKALIRTTVEAAKRKNISCGLCGQAPSDIPEFTDFLVSIGIDSISFNPDALLTGIKLIVEAEKKRT